MTLMKTPMQDLEERRKRLRQPVQTDAADDALDGMQLPSTTGVDVGIDPQTTAPVGTGLPDGPQKNSNLQDYLASIVPKAAQSVAQAAKAGTAFADTLAGLVKPAPTLKTGESPISTFRPAVQPTPVILSEGEAAAEGSSSSTPQTYVDQLYKTLSDQKTALQKIAFPFEEKYADKTWDYLQHRLQYLGPDSEEYAYVTELSQKIATPEDYKNAAEEAEKDAARYAAFLDENSGLARWYNDYQANPDSASYGMTKQEVEEKLALVRVLLNRFGSFPEMESHLLSLYEQKDTYKNAAKYSFLSENADFSELSSTIPYILPGSSEEYDRAKVVIDRAKGNTPGAVAEHTFTPQANYYFLTDGEVANYLYLYNKKGIDSADQYLLTLEKTVNARYADAVDKYNKSISEENPFVADAVSVGSNLIGILGLADVQKQTAEKNFSLLAKGEYTGGVDYNTPLLTASKTGGQIRSYRTENINNKYGVIDFDPEEHPFLSRVLNGKGWGDIYQLGMSTVDSAAAAGLKMLGIPGASVLLGGAAGTQGMLDALERGATDEEALGMGIMVGAFEMIFEEISLDKLLSDESSNLIVAMLKQSVVEGTEELSTSIANTVADCFVMAGKSDLSARVAAYRKEHPEWSESRALKEAWIDVAIQYAWDYIGGSASGGFMGGSTHLLKTAAGKTNAGGNVHIISNTATSGAITENAPVGTGLPDGPQATDTQQTTLDPAQDPAAYLDTIVPKPARAKTEQNNPADKRGDKNLKYQLVGYSQHQRNNWANSKRIVIYEGLEQFKNFIKSALSGKSQTNNKLYFGAIPLDLANEIKQQTGVSVAGYNLSLAENEIRKIKKSHGNESSEALRGQRAVTEADYLNIPNVIQSPDSISLSAKTYEGKPVIEFRQTNGNETTVVAAVVSDKRLDLFVQTTYINKKGSIATPESVQADSFTSETSGGTAPLEAEPTGAGESPEIGSLATPKGPASSDSIRDPGQNVNPSQDPASYLASIVPKSSVGNAGQSVEDYVASIMPTPNQRAETSPVDTSKQTDYDNGNLTRGGNSSGRKVDNNKSRRGSSPYSQEKPSADQSQNRAAEAGSNAAWDSRGGSRGNVRVRDSEGRSITPEIYSQIEKTAITDDDGAPIAVYHFTPEQSFVTFSKGDIGFHFGSKQQAANRAKGKDSTNGRVFRAYLNIQNPVYLDDNFVWRARTAAAHLGNRQVITFDEFQEVYDLCSQGQDYDSPASIRLREILESKGYDGIVYVNEFEGGEDSYIAFHDDQIVRSEVTPFSDAIYQESQAFDTDNGPNPSVGATDGEGYGQNTVGSAESRFKHEVKRSKQYSNTYANATDENIRAIGPMAKQQDPTIDQYDVVTEKESLHNADLRTRSAEERAAEYNSLMAKENWTAEDNDTAYKLIKYLMLDGNFEAAGKLERLRRENVTKWAQGVQSQAKYTRSPDQAYANGAAAINALSPNNVPRRFYKKQGFEAWKEQLSKSYVEMVEQVEQIKDGDIVAMQDVIRSLARFRHTTAWMGYGKGLTKAAEAGLANLDFNTAKTVALTQLTQMPGDFAKRSYGQVFKTLRFQSMLASLKSVVRNLGGNGAMITDAVSDSTVGQFFDFLVSKVTGQRTVGNDLAHPKEYLDAAKKACSFGSLCVELAIPTESDGKYNVAESRTFSPAVPGNSACGLLIRYLSAMEKYYSYAYGTTDTFFEAGSASAVDASLQKLGEASGLTDQQRQAVSEMVGRRRTFKEDGKLAETTKKVKDAFDFGLEYGLGTHYLPFSRVNANMAQAGLDYTSLGTKGAIEIFSLIRDAKKGVEIDPVRQRKAVTDAARGVTGAGLVALFTVFALSGVLKASDEDDWDRAAMEESTGQVGAQLNLSAALRILAGKEAGQWQKDDVTISLDFLEPFNTQMLLAYLLAEDIKAGEGIKNYPANSLKASIQSVLNNPSMELITDIYNLTREVGAAEDMTDAGAILGEAIGDTAASMVPAYVRQLAQTVDNVKRDTTSNDPAQAAANKFLANIPFASQTLPSKYGADGQPITRNDNPVLATINNFFNPMTVSVLDDPALSDQLGALSDKTGKTSFYPEASAPKKFTVGKTEILVEGKEMRETYQRTYMGHINTLYTGLLENPVFNGLSDDLKVKSLEYAKQYATEHAKASVSDFSLTTWVKETGSDPVSAILLKVYKGAQEDAGNKFDTEMYAEMTSSGVSDEVAKYVQIVMSGLTPEADHKNVRTIQELEAIMDMSDLKPKDEEAALRSVLDDDKLEPKYDVLTTDKYGLSNDEFVDTYRAYLDGGETKAEQVKAIMQALGTGNKKLAEQIYEIYNGKAK